MIQDNPKLLNLILSDEKFQPLIYRAGSYWNSKSRNATNEIKKFGLKDFRGSSNSIGTSCTDNTLIDYRETIRPGVLRRFADWLTKTLPCKQNI